MLSAPPKKCAYSASYDTFQTEYVPHKKVQKSSKEPEYLKWSCTIYTEGEIKRKGRKLLWEKRDID